MRRPLEDILAGVRKKTEPLGGYVIKTEILGGYQNLSRHGKKLFFINAATRREIPLQ